MNAILCIVCTQMKVFNDHFESDSKQRFKHIRQSKLQSHRIPQTTYPRLLLVDRQT